MKIKHLLAVMTGAAIIGAATAWAGGLNLNNGGGAGGGSSGILTGSTTIAGGGYLTNVVTAGGSNTVQLTDPASNTVANAAQPGLSIATNNATTGVNTYLTFSNNFVAWEAVLSNNCNGCIATVGAGDYYWTNDMSRSAILSISNVHDLVVQWRPGGIIHGTLTNSTQASGFFACKNCTNVALVGAGMQVNAGYIVEATPTYGTNNGFYGVDFIGASNCWVVDFHGENHNLHLPTISDELLVTENFCDGIFFKNCALGWFNEGFTNAGGTFIAGFGQGQANPGPQVFDNVVFYGEGRLATVFNDNGTPPTNAFFRNCRIVDGSVWPNANGPAWINFISPLTYFSGLSWQENLSYWFPGTDGAWNSNRVFTATNATGYTMESLPHYLLDTNRVSPTYYVGINGLVVTSAFSVASTAATVQASGGFTDSTGSNVLKWTDLSVGPTNNQDVTLNNGTLNGTLTATNAANFQNIVAFSNRFVLGITVCTGNFTVANNTTTGSNSPLFVLNPGFTNAFTGTLPSGAGLVKGLQWTFVYDPKVTNACAVTLSKSGATVENQSAGIIITNGVCRAVTLTAVSNNNYAAEFFWVNANPYNPTNGASGVTLNGGPVVGMVVASNAPPGTASIDGTGQLSIGTNTAATLNQTNILTVVGASGTWTNYIAGATNPVVTVSANALNYDASVQPVVFVISIVSNRVLGFAFDLAHATACGAGYNFTNSIVWKNP